jgi:hypothetical protein
MKFVRTIEITEIRLNRQWLEFRLWPCTSEEDNHRFLLSAVDFAFLGIPTTLDLRSLVGKSFRCTFESRELPLMPGPSFNDLVDTKQTRANDLCLISVSMSELFKFHQSSMPPRKFTSRKILMHLCSYGEPDQLSGASYYEIVLELDDREYAEVQALSPNSVFRLTVAI